MNSRNGNFRLFSAAAADALDLGVQESVTLLRRRIDVGVIAVAAVAGEFGAVRGVAAKPPAKSVTAKPVASRVG